MGTDFVRWDPSDGADVEALVDLLTGEDWPFHAGGRPDRAAVLARAAAGYYDGPAARTHWVVADGERAGVLRLYDLEDESPMFDLRIRAAHRSRGLGTAAVTWLTSHLFTELPQAVRVEATTRADNGAMRQVLRRCGYVQEARYRRAWPAADGRRLDSVGYAVLREEWAAAPPPAARPPGRPAARPPAVQPPAAASVAGGPDPREQAAADSEDVAARLELAARHLRRTAEHFRDGEVARACAHVLAAQGGLVAARRALDELAERHAARSEL